MGGDGPHLALNLRELKKKGFSRAMVADHTSGRKCALDVSMILYDAFSKLSTDELRIMSINLHEALANGTRAEVTPALHSAIDSVCRYWYEFLKVELEVDVVKAVFDGQQTEGKRLEREKRNTKRIKAHQSAFEEGISEKNYRSSLRKSMFLTWDMYKVAIATFSAVGAQVVIAVGEADAQICAMVNTGEVHFGVFADGDLFVHGIERALVGLRPSKSKVCCALLT